MTEIITGTPRPAIHCRICHKDYIDPCVFHCLIKNSQVVHNA